MKFTRSSSKLVWLNMLDTNHPQYESKTMMLIQLLTQLLGSQHLHIWEMIWSKSQKHYVYTYYNLRVNWGNSVTYSIGLLNSCIVVPELSPVVLHWWFTVVSMMFLSIVSTLMKSLLLVAPSTYSLYHSMTVNSIGNVQHVCPIKLKIIQITCK